VTDPSIERRTNPAPLSWVAVLLFVSGCCALVFQVVWMRELRLVFGATTAASAAVLAVFMGGLGLGNALLGQRIDRLPNPLRTYGWLEVGIALSAAATPLLLWAAQSTYIGIGGQSVLGPTPATLLRLLLSAAIMGVPTFLMGGTMPAAARAVADDADARRGRVALVYGVNTLGAVLGAALATFLLMEALGSRGALWATCGLNLLLGLVAVALARRHAALPVTIRGTRTSREPTKTVPVDDDDPHAADRLPAGLVYLAAAIVGFAFFLQEIVWYRMLGPLLGGTVYTFGLILCVALLGIGLGGALYHLLGRRLRPSATAFAWTCGLEALAIAIPFALGDRIALAILSRQGLTLPSFNDQLGIWFQVASLVILPAAVVSGVQFPLLIGLAGRGRDHVGAQVGRTFAANTLGAICGSLAGGFWLLPWLTAPGAWRGVVGLLCLLTVVTLAWPALRSRTRWPRGWGRWSPMVFVVAALACTVAVGPTAVWRHAGIGVGRARRQVFIEGNSQRDWVQGQRRNVLWEAEGIESSVAITGMDSLAFIVNGKSDGHAIFDAGTQIGLGMVGPMLADVPSTSHRDFSGLVIGLGSGETAGWLAALPSFSSVDVVELEPAILEMARCCAPVNRQVLENPKVRITLNDAREVLLTGRESFDFVISEPSNPYRAGIASLYTREFYQAVRDRLRPHGLLLQWLQGYEVDRRTVLIVLRTLREVFPRVEIWRTQSSDLVLVCGREPRQRPLDLDELRNRLSDPVMREALSIGWRIADAEGFLAHYVCGTATIDTLLTEQDLPVNTDDRNLLEYAFARSLGRSPEFSSTDTLRTAEALGDAYPEGIASSAWPTIDLRRMAMNAQWGKLTAPDATQTEAEKDLAQFFIHYSTKDYAKAAKSLSDHGPGHCPITRQAQAHALAETGAELPAELLDDIERTNPVDAAALRAISAWQRQLPQEAADAIERMAVLSRDDPWGSLPLIDRAFAIAADAGQADPAIARRIHAALAQPFAAERCQQRRLTMRYILAEHLGPEEMLAACQAFEPHVPWNESFLKQRAAVYAKAGHPLAATAAAEVRQYQDAK
jgi:spermidine synthase